MIRPLVLCALVLGFALMALGEPRVWEVNGIRLEEGQVERLADDLAARTVRGVEENVKGLALEEEQRQRLHAIYRRVALDTYAEIVQVLGDEGLDEDTREVRVRELVLEGQRRSHEEIEHVLSPEQMDRYDAWETAQVRAFESRRLGTARRRRRR